MKWLYRHLFIFAARRLIKYYLRDVKRMKAQIKPGSTYATSSPEAFEHWLQITVKDAPNIVCPVRYVRLPGKLIATWSDVYRAAMELVNSFYWATIDAAREKGYELLAKAREG